jgi:hypothetical protein
VSGIEARAGALLDENRSSTHNMNE